MNRHLIEQFRKTYKKEPQILAKAPGRLEILGNHTDYNEGFVLSTAVDSYTKIAMALANTEECRIYSLEMEDKVRTIRLDQLSKPIPGNDWTNYLRGVLTEFQKRNLPTSSQQEKKQLNLTVQ